MLARRECRRHGSRLALRVQPRWHTMLPSPTPQYSQPLLIQLSVNSHCSSQLRLDLPKIFRDSKTAENCLYMLYMGQTLFPLPNQQCRSTREHLSFREDNVPNAEKRGGAVLVETAQFCHFQIYFNQTW